MAQTLAEIRAALDADPQYATLTESVNGEAVPLSPAERNARLDEWASNERQRQLDAEAETARKTLRSQVRAALTRLDQIAEATGSFTNAQRDAAIQDMARFQAGLIRVLIDLHLIERTD